jgi:predicted Zn finger-like uncharacterized protein
MSLVTRCTSCSTVFRVVQDQLKVSEGWVRCGRCHQVFNALEGLFDLQRDAPAGWTQSHTTATEVEEPAAAAPTALSQSDLADVEVAGATTSFIEGPGSPIEGGRGEAERAPPTTRIGARDRPEFPDARFDPELTDDAAPLGEPSPSMPSEGVSSDHASAESAPTFMGSEVSRTRRRAQRAVLCTLAGVLTLGLAAQAAHHFRDLMAASWPVARPALMAWCQALRCELGPPRRIDEVSVESTALTRSSTADGFNLSVALRNRSETALAVPSVDLSLTDPSGQLVARRVLMPSDFRADPAMIPPRAEKTLQAMLTTGGARVTGYTVEVFYP